MIIANRIQSLSIDRKEEVKVNASPITVEFIHRFSLDDVDG